MGPLGCGLSVLAAAFLLLGLIPLLGWLNWITTLPLAALAAVFCYLTLRDRPGDTVARLGLIAGVIIFFLGIFRLSLGGGFV